MSLPQVLLTLPQFSLNSSSGSIATTTLKPSVTSEISDSCEHDLLISLNSTFPTTPCDTEFEESMTKSTFLDNASL